jgi:hypothetical protein
MDFVKKQFENGKVIPLIMCLGFVGSGKSTISKQLSTYLNSIGCKSQPVDGDNIFNLSMSTTMRLGMERQPLTIWEIAHVIMSGNIPVISAGGGVFFDFRTNKEILVKNLEKFFPKYKFVYYVFVPSNDGNFEIQKTDTSFIPELNQLYDVESDKRVEPVIKERIARGEWGKDTPIKKVLTLSKGNKKFAEYFLNNSYDSFKFPIIDSKMYDETGNFNQEINMSVMDVFRDFNFETPQNVHYHQSRILVDFPSINTMGHITLNYVKGKEPDIIEFPLYEEGKYPSTIMGRSIETSMVMLDENSKTKMPKNGSSFILITGKEAELVVDESSGISKTHITVNATQLHYPEQMGTLAIAINRGDESVEMKSKTNELILHRFKQLMDYPEVEGTCIVQFLIP